ARTRVDGDDRVAAVVLAGEQRVLLEPLELAPKRRDRGGDLVGHVTVHGVELARVFVVAGQPLVALESSAQTRVLGADPCWSSQNPGAPSSSSSSATRRLSPSGSKVITDPGELGPDLLELLLQRLGRSQVRHAAIVAQLPLQAEGGVLVDSAELHTNVHRNALRLKVVMGNGAAAAGLSGSMALLVLLARPAPAGVVAPDLVAVCDGAGRRRGRDRATSREEAARGDAGAVAAPVSGGSSADRLGTGCLLVLVGERLGLRGLRLLQALKLLRVLRLELCV